MNRENARFSPNLGDHQWYPLKQLRQGLETLLKKHQFVTSRQVILDMGCGTSPYRTLFEGPTQTYLTSDLEGEVDIPLHPGQPIALEDGSVDVVVSFQVLEHVWDLDWYLKEAYRVLKPGGWLLLSTHGTWLYHPHPTDYRRWTCDGLQREIEARGFTLRDMDARIGPLAWTTQFRLLGGWFVLNRIPILKELVLPFWVRLMNLRIWFEDTITPKQMREQNASIYIALANKPPDAVGGSHTTSS